MIVVVLFAVISGCVDSFDVEYPVVSYFVYTDVDHEQGHATLTLYSDETVFVEDYQGDMGFGTWSLSDKTQSKYTYKVHIEGDDWLLMLYTDRTAVLNVPRGIIYKGTWR